MGRGLSKLQKTILHDALGCRKALEKVLALNGQEWIPDPIAKHHDVNFRRILERSCELPKRGFYGGGRSQSPPTLADIPRGRYALACVAISRALRRLEGSSAARVRARDGTTSPRPGSRRPGGSSEARRSSSRTTWNGSGGWFEEGFSSGLQRGLQRCFGIFAIQKRELRKSFLRSFLWLVGDTRFELVTPTV
jgi:hypothetical protein